MPETLIDNPDIQFVPMTPEQAELLQHNPDALQSLGHTAMAGVEVIGVVPGTENTPAHFVNLNENDPGVRINVSDHTPKGAENYEKYGDPNNVAERLYGNEAADGAEQKGGVLSEITESAGFSDTLIQFEDKLKQLESVAIATGANVDALSQGLMHLESELRDAAESGPMAGNYLNAYTELNYRIEELSVTAAEMAARNETDLRSNQESLEAANDQINESSESISKAATNNEAAVEFSQVAAELAVTADNLAKHSAVSSATEMMWYIADTLTGIRGNEYTTASDVHSMIVQLRNRLDDVQRGLFANSDIQDAANRVDRIKQLIQK